MLIASKVFKDQQAHPEKEHICRFFCYFAQNSFAMEIDIKQFYKTHIDQLQLREKLELLELLMQSTLALVRKETMVNVKEPEAAPIQSDIEEKLSDSTDSNLTDFQKRLLKGPTMTDKDYNFYKEKKEHFAQWK